MRLTGDLQAVVMAGGKGSRMTDLTAGKAKCLLPVGNLPLLWYPLHMLQTCGFTEVLVIVQDSARAEVQRIPERHGLTIRVDTAGVPGQEELGTADSLRRVADRLTGSDILLVSGDLLLEPEALRGLTDLHRLNNAAFTMLLAGEQAGEGGPVPGSRSTKYKRERDLVGLAGDQLCLFAAEADVEEVVRLPAKVLAARPRVTVHSGLRDAHLYLLKRWIVDYVVADKNISTIKGELLPVLVRKQFSREAAAAGRKEDRTDRRPRLLDFLPEAGTWDLGRPRDSSSGHTRFGCFAYMAPGPVVCLRVNTVPAYWTANTGRLGDQLAGGARPGVGPRAEVGERAQLQDARVGEGSVVANKTSLTNVQLGAGCRVEEKVRLTNCVVMDNVVIGSGAVIHDSIICDNCSVAGTVKNCIVGRGQVLAEGSVQESQTLLSKDRMMEV